MEKAIKKAIEGGYDNTDEFGREFKIEKILLDPLFWQALGKAEGWCCDNTCDKGHIPLGMLEDGDVEWGGCSKCVTGGVYVPHDWRTYWHSFIDHLASGGEINKFFNELLK